MRGEPCAKKVSCKIKVRLDETVRPTVLHEAETWTITRAQEKKTDVVEMRH